MNYSVTNLTTVADCDFLINMANFEKASLDLKRHQDEFGTQRFAISSVELEAIYQSTVLELSANTTIYEGMPEGPVKDNAEIKIAQLQAKKLLLEKRRGDYGVIALLEKEMDFARIQQEITEVDAFISAVKARKDQLAA